MKEHLFTWATGNQLLLGLGMLVWRLGGCPTRPLLSLRDIPALLPFSHQLSHPDPRHAPVLSAALHSPARHLVLSPPLHVLPRPCRWVLPPRGRSLSAPPRPHPSQRRSLLRLRPSVPGFQVLLKSHHQSPKCGHPVSQCSLLSFKLI